MEITQIKRFLNQRVFYLLADDLEHEYIFSACTLRLVEGEYKYYANLLDTKSRSSEMVVELKDVIAKEMMLSE